MTMQRVPAELKALNQWCLWNNRDGTKVPAQPDGQPFKSNDPTTWHSFDRCEGVAAFHTGFGFALDVPYTGIDLDNCLDDDGKLRDWAVPILRRFDELAYAEISPSGRGIKLLTRARKVHGSICTHKIAGDKQQIESWDHGRYFAITGNVYNDQTTIGDGQAAVDWLCETYLKPTVPQQVATVKLPPAMPRAIAGDLMIRAVGYVDNVPGTVKGGLRNAAFSLSGHLHSLVDDYGNRLTDAEVCDLLARWNVRNSPPLRDDELLEASINGRTNGTPRADKPPNELIAVDHDLDAFDVSKLMQAHAPTVVTTKPAKKHPEKLPDDVLSPPGFLGEVSQYCLRTTWVKQPELALAGALALLATLCGGKIEDMYGNRTNIYLLGLAKSRLGKERPRKINRAILRGCGHPQLIGPEAIASSASIFTELSKSPTRLFQLDEIGRTLATLKDSAKTHLYKIIDVFLKLWSSADSEFEGDSYANSEQNKTLLFPHAVIFGTSVPESVWKNLTLDSITNGLLGRFLIFEGFGYEADEEDEVPKEDVPESILRYAAAIRELSTGGNLSKLIESNAHPIMLHSTEDARKRWTKHRKAIVAKRKTEDDATAAIWSGVAEKTAKLAMLFAMSRWGGGELPEIEFQDMDRAVHLSKFLTRRMLDNVKENISENDFDDKCQKVIRAIRRHGGRATLTQVSEALKGTPTRLRMDVLFSLEERDLIRRFEVPTNGRKATIFAFPESEEHEHISGS